MHGRRHGRKPTLALWMLVALADLAILATAAGAVIAFTVLGMLLVLAAGFAAAKFSLQSGFGWRLGRLDGRSSEAAHRRA